LRVDVSDLRGAGIERAIIYLEKVINVEVPQSSQRKEISVAQVIRNLVVHNDGYLKKDDSPSSRVREYAKKSKRLNMSDRGEIVLTEEFLPALLEDVREFAEQLKQVMEKRLTNDT
jgi:hypothetical protein